MSWLQVVARFEHAPEDWAVAANVFAEFGVESTVQTDHPATIGGYLHAEQAKNVGQLEKSLMAAGASGVECREIEEEDWSESWKQYFQPRNIGNRLFIRPVWRKEQVPDDRIELLLDPGQAFGTGDHPTTRMCLELLEQANPSERTVADIGCGSGILAVAACKLGASAVVAVDNDPVAVAASQANAELNGVEYKTLLGVGFEPLPPGQYGVVLSNIISAALIVIAPEAAQRTETGGHWIVSGIIQANWPDVLKAANRAGFMLEARMEELEWVAATFRR